ncbi:alpha-mannosidase isoform X1 [Selaginella moellendorffii]|uniref:alpha-mannosidase isoform X1 n=2 Tax=Selaginella moellendorffii TaxID=88036 RepID=UPI000D1C4226|nr:alpha-mannosidase isoform X1 [Selaginella moellendorffii]XP_024541410.1 alpha-mannosidase isoform X1 [Selaginella moellendorffii]|eukprot:XP_024541409.1 alpha-mannosidase isoform X1 [Selaginella moellendorffii]
MAIGARAARRCAAALLLLFVLTLLRDAARLDRFLGRSPPLLPLAPGIYNTSGAPLPHKINVHIVPHTHDDVGWLKTVDQYYVGSNNSIQIAAVQYIIDSVIQSLEDNPDRKFIYVEQAFFQRWWREQTPAKQKIVHQMVESGQLEFVNGAWCMHDEAGASYIDMIDQTTLGHRFIKSQFNKMPRIGWQIDPFGHSAVQAYLLGAEVGFDGLFFARADYQDIAKRRATRGMEFVWQGSRTLSSSSQIFGGILANHYSPPEGMNFDFKSNDPLIQDNPLLYDYNLQERIDLFVKRAQEQSEQFRSNHIMWTMGQDFNYEQANTWFKQLDKLVHYMNKDGRINVFYSTPSIYVDSKNTANITWPLKTEDFFPYANCSHCYWTGYFSSRLALKGYVRRLSAYLMAARQLEFAVGRNFSADNTDSLEDALAILQHHDAVTGTEQQHVANDYAKRLATGASKAAKVMEVAISVLTASSSALNTATNWFVPIWERLTSSKYLSVLPKGISGRSALSFDQCLLLNISYCPPSEAQLEDGTSLVVVLYNTLGWSRKEMVRIPVSSTRLQVRDSTGNAIPSQLIPLDSVTKKLKEIYVKAYTGNSSSNDDVYTLVFKASVPPLGFNSYFISASNGAHGCASLSSFKNHESPREVFSSKTKLKFSSSGQLQQFTDRKSGIVSAVKLSYCWYNSSDGVTEEARGQSSGAYVFRPNSSSCYPVDSKEMVSSYIKGSLVEEVHQTFSSWVFQVLRLYKDAQYAEIEYTIGPVPVNSSDAGKEIVTRISTDLESEKIFYTDSNGRDFLKRVRDFRSDWELNATEPISGNYYPINLGIYLQENNTEFSVLVDRAIGGSSLKDGDVELMVQRRLLHDDHRGVQEALNETICIDSNECEGLTVRGKFLLGLHSTQESARWRRNQGQRLYSPLEMFFSKLSSSTGKIGNPTFSATESGYELPQNIAIITLQEMQNGDVLLRLAHLYEAGEDIELSTVVRVDLQKIFGLRQVASVVELNLSANQERASMKPLQWQLDPNVEDAAAVHVRGPLLKPGDRHIDIAPMEIRTLLVTFG